MSKMLRFFVLDLRKGIASLWRRYALCFAGVIVLSLLDQSYYPWFVSFGADGALADPLSFGEVLISLFSGIKPYSPNSGVPFTIPFEWLFLVLMALYLVLDYPLSDLESTGTNTLVAGSGRSAWWAAKCFWAFVAISLFAVLVAASALFATLVAGGDLSLGVRAEVVSALNYDTGSLTGSSWNILPFLATLFIFLYALALTQMFLSLIAGPLPSFCCLAALLFFSAYYTNGLFPGEYLMAARSTVFLAEGFQPVVGQMFALGLIIWSALSGLAAFSQKDIYGKR